MVFYLLQGNIWATSLSHNRQHLEWPKLSHDNFHPRVEPHPTSTLCCRQLHAPLRRAMNPLELEWERWGAHVHHELGKVNKGVLAEILDEGDETSTRPSMIVVSHEIIAIHSRRKHCSLPSRERNEHKC